MLGIVIINYNSFENTIECVNSILDNYSNNMKIIIVDNCSTNNSFDILYEIFKDNTQVDILLTKINNGYSAGANEGIRRAIELNCEDVIISNNDLIYLPNTISKLLDGKKLDDNIGIIGPKIIEPGDLIAPSLKKKITFSNHIFSKKPFIYIDVFGIHKKVRYKDYKYDIPFFVDGMVGGECFLLTKKFLEKILFLDDEIFLFYEEDAIAYLLQRNDLTACIYPEAVVFHKGSTTIGEEGSLFTKYHRYKSSMYVLKKYAKISNFQLWILLMINLQGLKSKTNKSLSKQYQDNLKEYYEALSEMEKNKWN